LGTEWQGDSLAVRDTYSYSDDLPRQGGFRDLVDAADTMPKCPSETFVLSGLRAARGAQPAHRRTILTDIARVLGCNADELGFLFRDPVVAANDSDPVAMPDYRRKLHEDMRASL
ncbi:MAG: hypothetical protein AAF311_12875, partial [Pseudomonadota bacterium]